jgi:DHA2 family multidrug resistance protein
MQVLDLTIANVSLPTISGNLGGSANQATWVITSFAVSNAIALPLTGWLTRPLRRTQVVRLGDGPVRARLVAVRPGQQHGLPGRGARAAGLRRRPDVSDHAGAADLDLSRTQTGQAIALLAMVTVVAPIAGPILGGWITDNYSWEWIFFINVPIGIFASASSARS